MVVLVAARAPARGTETLRVPVVLVVEVVSRRNRSRRLPAAAVGTLVLVTGLLAVVMIVVMVPLQVFVASFQVVLQASRATPALVVVRL